ncbi:hypothetical protein [Mycoplasmopsis glycophila]|uniref:Uncharacterized protein n=1 Tax=Mycoplasmopsis glycophila TaxID=171285 RepID=A0A449AVB1_9BACT|nr:hypothetical protein [Mycoplasmopsis glycophila]VEU70441.1 Uncharacterised protein [Mycoplasmopsis glycophila]
MNEAIRILASGGVGALCVILFFTIKWLINSKKEPNNKNSNNININNQTNEKLDWVLQELREMKKSIQEIEDQQRKGDTAFLFYIESTEIDDAKKNNIKRLLGK